MTVFDTPAQGSSSKFLFPRTEQTSSKKNHSLGAVSEKLPRPCGLRFLLCFPLCPEEDFRPPPYVSVPNIPAAASDQLVQAEREENPIPNGVSPTVGPKPPPDQGRRQFMTYLPLFPFPLMIFTIGSCRSLTSQKSICSDRALGLASRWGACQRLLWAPSGLRAGADCGSCPQVGSGRKWAAHLDPGQYWCGLPSDLACLGPSR